jgi:DNA repair exonuclease SbcCD nuclease subunit
MLLLTADLHLDDHSRDSSHFNIFPWLAKQQIKYDTVATCILGDITNAKDRHSATLVNRIVNGLVSLRPPVYILRGNHDYHRDQNDPFFNFLNQIDGLKFITDPTVVKAGKVLGMTPHYRTQEEFNLAVDYCAGARPDCFLVHQTFEGAIAETGVRLNGLQASPIEFYEPPLGVYAGDVHRPQTQGLVTYVGCPYHVRFGDNFEPRCLLVGQNGTQKELYFDAPRKWALTVRGPEELLSNKNLYAGDQVKLTIEMAREEAVEWKKVKQEILTTCKKLQLEVFGAKMEIKTTQRRKRVQLEGNSSSNVDTLELFCKAENIATQIKQTGIGFINGNKDVL